MLQYFQLLCLNTLFHLNLHILPKNKVTMEARSFKSPRQIFNYSGGGNFDSDPGVNILPKIQQLFPDAFCPDQETLPCNWSQIMKGCNFSMT